MNKHILKISFLTFGLVLIDQLTKYWALKSLSEPMDIIHNLFKFQYSENTGIAFSIPIPFLLIIIITILLLGFVIYIANEELDLKKTLPQFLTALILAGGMGNLIDRIVHSFVIDFISIWKWPIFNIADVYISVSVLAIILFYGKIKRIKK